MPVLPLHMCFAIELTKKFKYLEPYPFMVGTILPDCIFPGDTKSFRASHCLNGSVFQAENIVKKFGDVVRHPEDWALMVGWHAHVYLDAYDRRVGAYKLGMSMVNKTEKNRMRFYDAVCDYGRESILEYVNKMVRVPTPLVTVLEQMMRIQFKDPQDQLRSVLRYIDNRQYYEPDEVPIVKEQAIRAYLEKALEEYPYEELGLQISEEYSNIGDTNEADMDQLDMELNELLKNNM